MLNASFCLKKRKLRKNESEVFRVKIPQRKVTKCNTYNYSFFFIIVFLQFSIKVYFSGWMVLITNSKLVISVGKRRGFSRRLWFLIKELFCRKKIFLVWSLYLDENHRFPSNPHSHQLWVLYSQKKERIPIPDAASERV